MSADIKDFDDADIYSDAGSIFDGLSASAQESLKLLDRALHGYWKVGRNVILLWSPKRQGIEILIIPHYDIANFASGVQPSPDSLAAMGLPDGASAASLMDEILGGPKQVSSEHLGMVAEIIGYATEEIDLPIVPGQDLSLRVIDSLVKRYSLSYVDDRAVALFDIVGFSLISPLEQVTQLNSLAYSVNAAHSKMLAKKIDITFARTTTGDGFYVWNRDRSIQANINLYHFMHLVMADNAIAASKSKGNVTPRLRTCFHVGGHYEFYQSEGLSPTIYSYIVGDVTIELARMIDKAIPGQVMVGDFLVSVLDKKTEKISKINTVEFLERTQETLSNLKGLVLSGAAVDSINCYLTGDKKDDGSFSIKMYLITDKHDLTRNVYNAKINIYRENAAPIFIGVQDQELKHLDFAAAE